MTIFMVVPKIILGWMFTEAYEKSKKSLALQVFITKLKSDYLVHVKTAVMFHLPV